MITVEEVRYGLQIARFYLRTDPRLDGYYNKAVHCYQTHTLQTALHYLDLFFKQLEETKLGWRY